MRKTPRVKLTQRLRPSFHCLVCSEVAAQSIEAPWTIPKILKAAFIREALAATTKERGPPLVFSPFRDWNFYYLREPIAWKPDDPASPLKPVQVPKGFRDGPDKHSASVLDIPAKTGAYAYAAIPRE